ncbi:hypothetical protein [Paracidovorax sp. MALMAid1276]|uniref:hypothetical protein n=1 Tax=Paracidovorax sp. MALMAid1276 TaxID=3411631 RepID=UPI003B9C07EB
MVNIVKIFAQAIFFAGISGGVFGHSQASDIFGGHSSDGKNDTDQKYCASASSMDEKEDCLRNTARALSLHGIKSIKITSSRYFDSQGGRCRKGLGPVLNKAKVVYFIDNSIPVSQMAVMNYFGQHGECVSDSVKITLLDGKVVNFSLSSEGKVAYLSPVVRGRETDVFFYYCDVCSK